MLNPSPEHPVKSALPSEPSANSPSAASQSTSPVFAAVLPTHHLSPSHPPGLSAVLSSYLSRLSDPRTLDLNAALSQMRHLLRFSDGIGTGPSRVYKAAYYRKQTKDHWARDDPSFCVLSVAWMVIACVFWRLAWGSAEEGVGLLGLVVRSVLFHWLAGGAVLTEAGRRASERLATTAAGRGVGGGRHVRQSVEWMYAWDIHCNAYFVWFTVVWGVQFFLSKFLVGENLFPFIVSNALYAVAFTWYFYVTHLGYRALPFLSNTEVFLYPIVAVVLIVVLNFILFPLGLGVNPSHWAVGYYFGVF
eukprot:CAMPEP_0194331796 /NCGR_PEP_ID=MMETSP0171-20130528/56951_1 /TAXON_ID=218684 /ORGANISM="Corethron pennatum, Strain L29A3" /LENGTH=303 /DNA_ID=CAMNT_0039093417 /DNA_START=133 /DNA_END=1044 /DNA_ORIENTATION=+